MTAQVLEVLRVERYQIISSPTDPATQLRTLDLMDSTLPELGKRGHLTREELFIIEQDTSKLFQARHGLNMGAFRAELVRKSDY